MKFFIDNNLSPHLAHGMKAFQEDVTHLTDHFLPETADEEWLPHVGQNGWFLITRDERIRKNPLELSAIRKHAVGAFFLGGKNRTRCDLIRQLVRHFPRMKELAAKTRRPFAYRIPPTGSKIESIPL
jgi:predicted nuclease of predicted toxin-antitoxin system